MRPSQIWQKTIYRYRKPCKPKQDKYNENHKETSHIQMAENRRWKENCKHSWKKQYFMQKARKVWMMPNFSKQWTLRQWNDKEKNDKEWNDKEKKYSIHSSIISKKRKDKKFKYGHDQANKI